MLGFIFDLFLIYLCNGQFSSGTSYFSKYDIVMFLAE
jgi:hypothetical protein